MYQVEIEAIDTTPVGTDVLRPFRNWLMHRTFKYRLVLKPSHGRRLDAIREEQRLLYNAALQERRDAYRHGQRMAASRGSMKPDPKIDDWRTITKVDQFKSLTSIRRDDPEGIGAVLAKLSRWTLSKVDFAFQAMFDRVKAGRSAGYPRVKPFGRFASIGFSEFSGVAFKGGRLRFKGCPSLNVAAQRPIPDGASIRSLVVSEDAKGWFVAFQVKLDDVAVIETDAVLGIDVGVSTFAALSDGTMVESTMVGRKAAKRVRRRQRAIARCRRGSNRRAKVRRKLTRSHARIASARRTHAFQAASAIVRRAAQVGAHLAVEDLRVRNMTASARGTVDDPGRNVRQKVGLNRSILDAAPAAFLISSRTRLKAPIWDASVFPPGTRRSTAPVAEWRCRRPCRSACTAARPAGSRSTVTSTLPATSGTARGR